MDNVTKQLASLMPTTKRLVMDLIEEAGIDVSGWRNYVNGAKAPAANPKYCYEWVFRDEPDIVVLNVWYQEMVIDGQDIVIHGNMRNIAQPSNGSGMGVRSARAKKVDSAVRAAWYGGFAVRAVICSGTRRSHANPEVRSRVRTREMDSVPWSVRSYDEVTGDFAIVRGEHVPVVRDQFDLNIVEQTPTEMRSRSGTVYIRSGEIRRHANERARGKCELCGRRGFPLPSGGVYLETHHIIPLSEGGADSAANVAAVCANHHREAHYGANKEGIAKRLLAAVVGVRHGVSHSHN